MFSPMTYVKNEIEKENENRIENNENDENNLGESIEVNDTKTAEAVTVTVVAVEVNKGDMSNSLPNSTVAPVLSRPVQEKEQDADRDIDLWDAVLAKQSKSKKRMSRRYVTNCKDQFSISDEVNRSASNDSTEINNAPIGKGMLLSLLLCLYYFNYFCSRLFFHFFSFRSISIFPSLARCSSVPSSVSFLSPLLLLLALIHAFFLLLFVL